MRAPYGERAVIISLDGETNTTADGLYKTLDSLSQRHEQLITRITG